MAHPCIGCEKHSRERQCPEAKTCEVFQKRQSDYAKQRAYLKKFDDLRNFKVAVGKNGYGNYKMVARDKFSTSRMNVRYF